MLRDVGFEIDDYVTLDGKTSLRNFPISLSCPIQCLYRIVPSTNRMLQAWNGIGFYRPSIEIIATGLSEGENDGTSQVAGRTTPSASRLPLREELAVSTKSFAYPTNPHFGLADIDLTIRRGQTIGLIGQSGSGKTTLVDLILGAGCQVKVRFCLALVPAQPMRFRSAMKENGEPAAPCAEPYN